MDFNAAHAGFVTASYALTALCIIALIVVTLHRDKKLAAKSKDRTKP